MFGTIRYSCVELYLLVARSTVGIPRLRLGPVCARYVACGARLHRACPASHVMHAFVDGYASVGAEAFPTAGRP